MNLNRLTERSQEAVRDAQSGVLTPDQVELLRSDNVVSEPAKRDGRTLAGLGIVPESIAAIVPTYLWRFRKTGQFRKRTA